ncbi:MAG: DUF5675 family protein [Cytophagales bacterium]|nr:DUF5675 family protein [Cytophagales bacterium]MDW8383245.1 DUF5675 family protein [Flammeovirgaceae bacterium]
MKAIIERQTYTDKQVLGELTLYNPNGQVLFKCKTLELPWRDNQPKISCIPTGNYRAVFRGANEGSGKYGNHYRIFQADGVSEVPGRSFILIHHGNTFWDIKGCILIGVSHQDLNKDGYCDVTASRPTMAKLVDIAGKNGFDLEIKGAQPEYGIVLRASKNPIPDLQPGDRATIIANQLNIRQEANGTAPVVVRLQRGSVLNILDAEGAWAHVKVPPVRGWVHERFVEERGSLGEVTAGPLNIRARGEQSAPPVAQPLAVGTKLVIFREVNGWLEVETETPEGFAATAYLRKV